MSDWMWHRGEARGFLFVRLVYKVGPAGREAISLGGGTRVLILMRVKIRPLHVHMYTVHWKKLVLIFFILSH